MIEQESHEADNPSRVPTARQARYESVAASTAMLVRALPGRALALPLWHRVRAVWMPTLGSAALVATAVLPARPRELICNYLELGSELPEQVVVLSSSSDSEVRDPRPGRQGRRAPAPRHVRVRPWRRLMAPLKVRIIASLRQPRPGYRVPRIGRTTARSRCPADRTVHAWRRFRGGSARHKRRRALGPSCC